MFLNGFCLTETAYHQLRTAIAAANWRGRDVAFARRLPSGVGIPPEIKDKLFQPFFTTKQFFAATRVACDYIDSARALPLACQKFACNLLLVGAEILSRGGRLALSDGPGTLDLQAIGEGAFLSSEASAALMVATPVSALTSRTVQPYFTGLLAGALGWRLSHRTEPWGVRLMAVALTG